MKLGNGDCCIRNHSPFWSAPSKSNKKAARSLLRQLVRCVSLLWVDVPPFFTIVSAVSRSTLKNYTKLHNTTTIARWSFLVTPCEQFHGAVVLEHTPSCAQSASVESREDRSLVRPSIIKHFDNLSVRQTITRKFSLSPPGESFVK